MGKIIKVEPRTEAFIKALEMMKKEGKNVSNGEMAKVLELTSVATISEIKGRRQNIQPETWKLFKKYFKQFIQEDSDSLLQLQDEGYEPYKADQTKYTDAAMLQVLILEVAKLKRKVFGVSTEDAIDELEQNAKLALKQAQRKQ